MGVTSVALTRTRATRTQRGTRQATRLPWSSLPGSSFFSPPTHSLPPTFSALPSPPSSTPKSPPPASDPSATRVIFTPPLNTLKRPQRGDHTMWFSASKSILDNVLETLVAEKRQTPIQTVTIPMYPHTRPGPPPSASSTFSAEEVGVEVVVGVEEEEEDHIRVRTMEPPIKRK